MCDPVCEAAKIHTMVTQVCILETPKEDTAPLGVTEEKPVSILDPRNIPDSRGGGAGG